MQLPSIRRVNKKLKLLRRKYKYSQMDISVITNNLVSPTKLSHFEQGYVLPTEEEAESLAKALKVSKDEIINTFKR